MTVNKLIETARSRSWWQVTSLSPEYYPDPVAFLGQEILNSPAWVFGLCFQLNVPDRHPVKKAQPIPRLLSIQRSSDSSKLVLVPKGEPRHPARELHFCHISRLIFSSFHRVTLMFLSTVYSVETSFLAPCHKILPGGSVVWYSKTEAHCVTTLKKDCPTIITDFWISEWLSSTPCTLAF